MKVKQLRAKWLHLVAARAGNTAAKRQMFE